MSIINSTSDTPAVPGAGSSAAPDAKPLSRLLVDYFNRLRSGDIGSLAIIIGAILIAIIGQAANSNFISPRNFVNLLVQMSGPTAIAYGVVFVLLLGEIDLSLGYVGAVGGSLMTVLMIPPNLSNPDPTRWQVALGVTFIVLALVIWWAARRFVLDKIATVQRIVAQIILVAALIALGYVLIIKLVPTVHIAATIPWYVAVPVALVAVSAIGLLQGTLITAFQLPSFVVTLAGLLGWSGVVLLIVGQGGTVIIQDPIVNGITGSFLPPVWGWVVAIVAVAIFAGSRFLRIRERRAKGLSVPPMPVVIVQILVLALCAALIVWFANLDGDPTRNYQRGLPVVSVILLILLGALTFLTEQTRFGRYIYAIGGNKEAARRAGIAVERIRTLVFVISGLMAGVGGIFVASTLRSVDTNQGGGNLLLNAIAAAVIGGTSLFGGRGRVSNAILGAFIIYMIVNLMALLGLTAALQFIITGIVLVLAVLIDAISRSSQKRAGLA